MPSTRVALIAGITAMLVVIGLASLSSDEPTANAAKADADAVYATAEQAAATPSSSPEPSATRDRGAALPNERAAAPSSGNDVDRLRIVGEYGAPLPGADYFEGALPLADPDGFLVCEALRDLWHPDAWLQRCRPQVADADGGVTWHHSCTPSLYVARHGGQLAFWARGSPELRFVKERTCRIKVVDAAGQSIAGAAVVLRCTDPQVGEPIVGVTDASGVCVAAHLQRLSADDQHFDLPPFVAPRFGVRGLGLHAADVLFDAAKPPTEVTLTLPPCGRIAVELLDPDGTRLASREPVRLLGTDGEELDEYTRMAGPIEFGLCACGLQLAVTAADNHRFPGPRDAGERVVESLRLTDLQPGGYVITGRALAADHTPLAECHLYASSNMNSRPYSGDTATSSDRTTANGRFAFVFAAGDVEKFRTNRGLGILQTRPVEDGAIDQRGVVKPLKEPLRTGITDIGDVVLADAIVLVRGCVRDAGGPVADAEIRPAWYAPGLEVVQKPFGQFEVRGLPCRLDVGLAVRAKGRADKEVHSWLPCEDLDIVLSSSGRWIAVVDVDPELSSRSEAMRFELVNAAGKRYRNHNARTSGWYCRWDVPPGTYRCEVRAFQSREPIAVVPALVGTGDLPTEPVHIDLRGRLRIMHLRWVAAAGGAIDADDSRVYVPPAPEELDGKRAVDSISGEGDCVLLGTGAPMSIAFRSSTFTGAWSGPFGDTDVRVHRVPEVPFRIPDLPPAPNGDSWTLRAIAKAGDATTVLHVEDFPDVRPNGITSADVNAAGLGTIRMLPRTRYELVLRYSPADGSTRRSLVLRPTSGDFETGVALPGELALQFDVQDMMDAVR